jgi:mycothiol synthase
VTDREIPLTVEHAPDQLTAADRVAVAALVEAATAADGVGPVSEDGRLAVENGRSGALHLVSRDPAGAVAGYLYLGPVEDAADRTAELFVVPASRGRGIGRALVSAAVEETEGTLRAWAHGDLPAAKSLAARLGFTAVRDLRLLELELRPDRPWRQAVVPVFPDGAAAGEIRAFRPGHDEAAWLALNTAAFAHHPEQGRWTERDLAERMAEPWFDPAGFLLLERGGRLIGFHWTKVHPAGEYGPGPVGEIYVLGVHPEAAGGGLGRRLAEAGLIHLAQLGLDSVVLYVDGDNAPALRLYESLDFHTRSVDALYERRRSR